MHKEIVEFKVVIQWRNIISKVQPVLKSSEEDSPDPQSSTGIQVVRYSKFYSLLGQHHNLTSKLQLMKTLCSLNVLFNPIKYVIQFVQLYKHQ